jgi:hypothetical protein
MNKSPTEEVMELLSESKDISPMSESNGSRAEPDSVRGVTASCSGTNWGTIAPGLKQDCQRNETKRMYPGNE